ncbi:hypothetical protein K2173_001764 [Erythroxylum novogranatense]|uniref:Retrovirus-related Pol polyprotein from transposon TNT 1-94 n=1 Tax=Erythroxylum novogranatense TaxID=1862640 RepID=A0AAV8SJC3_9ROSI|nr:hypothetical protein K2173_001764 [Erythroxylum novogranatense]
MKTYGDKLSDETVVSKVLRSLTDRFNHVVATIEESHNLSTYGFDELMSSLQAHEDRLNASEENVEEKAFQLTEESFFIGRSENSRTRGHGGRGGFQGRGRGRGRGSSGGDRRQSKSGIECYYCKKFGHREADCWTKQRDEQNQASFTEKPEEESNMFMAHSLADAVSNDVWFIDSGCSNHMTGIRQLFKQLDESQKSEVRLGDDKLMKVEGRGTIAIQTSNGNIKLLHNNGIHRELTTSYTPEQNGIAERKNRTVVEMGRSMLQEKGIPKCFRAEAVAATVYLLNISPTKAVLNQTPYEAWRGNNPKVSHLRVFGCILDEKSEKCVFIGYSTQSKAYKLYNPISGKVIISKDVMFNEAASWNFSTANESSKSQLLTDYISDQAPTALPISSPPENSPTISTSPANSQISSPSSSSNSTPSSSSSETPPRGKRSFREIYENFSFVLYVTEPTTFEEAVQSENWCDAMMTEMLTIDKNKT